MADEQLSGDEVVATMEAMMAGTHEDEGAEPQDGAVEEELTNDEDTSQEADPNAEADIDNQSDGSEDQTGEENGETEVDNTLVDDNSSEEEVTPEPDANEGGDEPAAEVKEEEPTETKDETDTEEKGDGQVTENTEEIDYKAFYDKVVNTKFTANKKEVTGFKDPEDLIRAQQALHGYESKMKTIKEHAKFIKPLKEHGMLDDPDKFNLAISAANGDKEAIAKLVKDNNIDPLLMDVDNINYQGKDYRATAEEITVEEAFDKAESLGVDAQLATVLKSDWDATSQQEFIKNGAVRNDLINHLQSGRYDEVNNRIVQLRSIDVDGTYKSMSTVDQYRAAASQIAEEEQKVAQANVVVPKTEPVQEEKVDLEATKQAIEEAAIEKYKAQLDKDKLQTEKEVTEDAKKAASVSQPKPKAKPKTPPAPESLSGDDFRKYFDTMLMS